MVLSDATIARYLAEGRIEIDPYDESLLQPSSVDVRVDALFRVFHNNRYPFIDVKTAQEDLTELVEVTDAQPFVLHPGEFVLGSTLERVRLPEDLVARLEGKALALDTDVPTSRGWRTMGELAPGDVVFDEDGLPVVVLNATPPMVDRECFEVVFSDGTTVVADADHLWCTVDKNGRRHRSRYGGDRRDLSTTRMIAQTLRAGGELNHHVPLSGAVWYPEQDLPVEPYVLGAWLGDGTSTNAEPTSANPEVLSEVLAGYEVRPHRARPHAYRIGSTARVRNPSRDVRTGRCARSDSLQSTLREVGVLADKHIPEQYLRASIAQRTALLQGLMDADGSVDVCGRCDFTTTTESLAGQVMELVAGLGFRPTLARKRAKLYGKDCGPRFEVRFTPDRPVFRLPPKLARQKTEGRFHRFRSIVDVRPVASVPVRCIEVSSPNGLFLVTRSYVATHNSSLGRLGLLIHSTAGFIDPGWDGHVTLELSNVANLPITIYPGMKIGQISFMQMTEPAATPYGASELGSKYKGQKGPTPSRYYKNFET